MNESNIVIYTSLLSRKTQSYMKAVVKEFDLSPADAIVLINADQNPGIIQEKIAANLALDDAAVARSLKQMEKRGLIDRIINEQNQRTKKVYLTPLGKEYVTKIKYEMKFWDSIVFRDISVEEQEAIMSSLLLLKEKALDIDIDAVLELRKSKDL